jgi:hypothetical protein
MLFDPKGLMTDFARVASIGGLSVSETDIAHETLLAPHKSPKLPQGKCAVYVFSLSRRASAEAGSQVVVLKVGKAGPNTKARFEHQHYGVHRAPSTLAKSLVRSSDKWASLGIDSLTEENVDEWLKSNTDRDHFFLDCVNEPFLDHLEMFLRAKLHPIFEGRV